MKKFEHTITFSEIDYTVIGGGMEEPVTIEEPEGDGWELVSSCIGHGEKHIMFFTWKREANMFFTWKDGEQPDSKPDFNSKQKATKESSNAQSERAKRDKRAGAKTTTSAAAKRSKNKKIGNWEYDDENEVIFNACYYEIDLRQNTGAKEWLYHMAENTWINTQDLIDLDKMFEFVKKIKPTLPVFTCVLAQHIADRIRQNYNFFQVRHR